MPPRSAGRSPPEREAVDAPRDFPLDRLPASRYRCQFAT
ncbi:hypothetical protein C7S16_2312 [Burkholderia thailandensis]|uniref:Uncharacterized protein n=1 Tax=Burkholderia thailandensis TaxID=57975 RepID=A0AAW9D1J7_BURTH|nr:hypothetical protein [Burkholderia thailandensis]MDW9256041.1 hypothetical protein [Burkholderia thailandensis]